MSQVEMNPYEAVLRMCADAAPNAWHPHKYAQRSGVPLDTVNAVLKELWNEGLLEKAPSDPEHGPGLRLSARGWEVVNDRQAMQRLREGVALDTSERAETVRDSLRQPRPAYVSRVLLAMNVLVFLFGLYLAYANDVAGGYLSGSGVREVSLIRHRCGMMTGSDWLRGDWWRLLSACFVHGGALHILMNMYMLYSAGQFIERIWGPWRFLTIYLVAGVTGSLTGVATNPGGIVGASGALCGIFAAEGVWVLFNGRYLPADTTRQWRNHLLVNFALLAFISFLPGISLSAHAGGFVAGGVAAACLHLQRFGPPLWRWAALLGILPVPFGGLLMLNHMRQSSPAWASTDKDQFEHFYPYTDRGIEQPLLIAELDKGFTNDVRPVLEKAAERRGKTEVDQALVEVAKGQKWLRKSFEIVSRIGPYANEEVRARHQKAHDALKERLEVYDRVERSLREGDKYPADEEKKLAGMIDALPELRSSEAARLAAARRKEKAEEDRKDRERREQALEAARKKREALKQEETTFEEETLPRITKPIKAAYKLYHDDLTALLDRDPAERVPQTVKKNLAAIDEQRKQLNELVELLPTLGPFKSETITSVVEQTGPYAKEFAKLLEASRRALEVGDKWTDEDRAALKKQEKKVAELRKVWQDLFEQ